MMDWTDRHCRVFHRLLTRRAVLYTEMVTAAAVVRGDRTRLLGFDPAEHPVVLQLGGSDPRELADAAQIGEAWGYDEINLNVGCPSDRVQSGRFGACLMAEPDLVAQCIDVMRCAVRIPVTVKCRIGIDDMDDDAGLSDFVTRVAGAGCTHFIVHARKAWLSGLSPKQNREVPPLNYDRVFRLKQANPDLTIIINGGFTTLEDCKAALRQVDGVMVGRAAYQTPFLLRDVDAQLYGESGPVACDRLFVLEALRPHVAAHLNAGGRLNNVTRHILGLFHGQPRARAFRRFLSENATGNAPGIEIYDQAVAIAAGQVRYAA